jgi:hypothetical protein
LTSGSAAAWTDAVEADDLPHLHRFVRGLRRDYHAVLSLIFNLCVAVAR